MRDETTHKKFRRWPPRVKRRRHAPADRPAPGAGSPRGNEAPPGEPAPEAGRHGRPAAGREVKVSFRPRRRPVSPAEP